MLNGGFGASTTQTGSWIKLRHDMRGHTLTVLNGLRCRDAFLQLMRSVVKPLGCRWHHGQSKTQTTRAILWTMRQVIQVDRKSNRMSANMALFWGIQACTLGASGVISQGQLPEILRHNPFLALTGAAYPRSVEPLLSLLTI